jgi:lipopolysaccharide export system permease protein
MNKLIFRKLSIDILKFFLFASFCITFIVWIIQAVNLLDLVSEDGHSLKVYSYYMSLSLPKIFSRTIIFVFFISIFYIIAKYKNSNELIVFWTNGIKKINFINFIFRFSITFLLLQLILNLFIVPNTQNLGRIYIKNSNIDFLPKLISEKKFINVANNLTIFVEEYKKDGLMKKIYIKEKIDNNSKIIVAANGKFIKKNNSYMLRLYKGGITNIEKNNTYNIKFSETDYDFSIFSTKTVTHQKVQEIDSFNLFNCIKNYHFEKNFNNMICDNREPKSLTREMYKRLIVPFYTMIISLIAASLIIEPKSYNFIRFYNLYIFSIGVIIIILSQISLRFIDASNSLTNTIIFLPIVLVLIYYLFLILKTKFKLSLL